MQGNLQSTIQSKPILKNNIQDNIIRYVSSNTRDNLSGFHDRMREPLQVGYRRPATSKEIEMSNKLASLFIELDNGK